MKVKATVNNDLSISVDVVFDKMDNDMAEEILITAQSDHIYTQYQDKSVFSITVNSIFEVEQSIDTLLLAYRTYHRKKDYIEAHLNRIVNKF